MRRLVFIVFLYFIHTGYAQVYFNSVLENPMNHQTSNVVINSSNNYEIVGGRLSQSTTPSIYISEIDNYGQVLSSSYFHNDTIDFRFVFNSVALHQNELYICGYFKSPTITTEKPFLLKLDENRDSVWFKTFDHPISDTLIFSFNGFASSNEQFLSICGVIESPTTGFDTYFAKVDSSGSIIMEQQYNVFNASSEQAFSVGHCLDGGFLLTGYSQSITGNNLNPSQLHSIKIDSLGNFQWQRFFGGPDDDGGYGQPSQFGGYYLYGTSTDDSDGSLRAYLIKLNSSGVLQWDTIISEFPGQDQGFNSFVETPEGDIVLCGSKPNGNGGGWLIKLDSMGNVIWDRVYSPRTSATTLFQIRQTNDNGFVACGWAAPQGGINPLTYDPWIIKTDEYGCASPSCNLSINETSKDDFSLYPNPTSGLVTIKAPKESSYEVYNSLGKIVLRGNTGKLDETNISLDGFPTGVYHFRLKFNGNSRIERIILQ